MSNINGIQWKPAIGEPCEYETTIFIMYKERRGLCSVIAYHNDKVWIAIEGGYDLVIQTKRIIFRPLTSESKYE
jgi:hypothetical protein